MISIFIQLKSQALGWRTIKLAVFKTISVANTSSNIDRDGMLSPECSVQLFICLEQDFRSKLMVV